MVYVREDVENRYKQGTYSDNSLDINEKYDAYKNI
jgi:hypothetical protein